MKMRPMSDSDWPAFCAYADRHFGMSHNTDPIFNQHWFRCRGVAPEQEDKLDGWNGLVLEDDGQIVGIMVFIVLRASFAGKSYPMAWISTGVVQDEARSVGAGSQLYLWIYRNFPLVGALSGNDLSRPINALMAHEIPGLAMRRYIMMHDAHVSELMPENFAGDVSPLITRLEPAPGLRVEWSVEPPADVDELWSRFREAVTVTTDRTSTHYRWRVERAPYVDYRFLSIRRETRLVGLSVVRFQVTPAGPVCRVIDFMSESDDATECWTATARANADAGGLFSDFHVVGTVFDSALENAGFRQPGSDPRLDALPNLLSPLDHRKWTNTFHLGGSVARGNSSWREAGEVYFTKFDSDRDWPTPYELERLKNESIHMQGRK